MRPAAVLRSFGPIFLLLALLARSVAATKVSPAPAQYQSRLVAVGDLHGDMDQAMAVLRLAGVVGPDDKWSGGKAVLVQTGDIMDRGDDSLKLLSFFEDLRAQAEKAGGAVHTLLGNHELMNLKEEFGYVSMDEMIRLGGSERWEALMDEDGRWGSALRLNPVAVVAGQGPCRTLFAHAGLPSAQLYHHGKKADGESDTTMLARLNKRSRDEIDARRPDEGRHARKLDITAEDGPMWNRFFGWGSEAAVCASNAASLKMLGAHRQVIGHTPQKDGRVRPRCSGALAIIDVGICHVYGSHRAAWECVVKADGTGEAAALYDKGRREVIPLTAWHPMHNEDAEDEEL